MHPIAAPARTSGKRRPIGVVGVAGNAITKP
jgi:hypothetical protein